MIYMKNLLIPPYSIFIKERGGMLVLRCVTYQRPLLAYRVTVHVFKLLKNKLFTIAFFSVKAVFKNFMPLSFACLPFLYSMMEQVEQIVLLSFLQSLYDLICHEPF